MELKNRFLTLICLSISLILSLNSSDSYSFDLYNKKLSEPVPNNDSINLKIKELGADAGRLDAGRLDAGRLDAGRLDTGRLDTGRLDTGRLDTGRLDTGKGGKTETPASVIDKQKGISRIELDYSRKNRTLLDKLESRTFEKMLKQFGYDFFENSRTVSSSLDMMPVPPEYKLGPGDSLMISVWGSINANAELILDRSGEISIPKAGVVRLWDMSLDEAKQAIEKSIQKYYKNFDLAVSLGRLKTIQVFVVGEVSTPGMFPVSSFSTAVNALTAAGGPTRNGSLRKIKVTRAGKQIAVIDLYDMLISGDRAKDIQLKNGDTLFVPVISESIAVAGEVKRPAIYEITPSTKASQAINMAGGFKPGALLSRIQLERYTEDGSKTVIDLKAGKGTIIHEIEKLTLQDGDMLKVFQANEQMDKVVSLSGNVHRPGEYQFKEGMKLLDLIPDTSLLLPESYLESVEILRMRPPEFKKEILTTNIKKAFEGSTSDNILLNEQDSVKVFSRWQMEVKPSVTISGAVTTPGVYEYVDGMTVRDLISLSGALRRNAYLALAELSRVEFVKGKAESKRVQVELQKALRGNIESNLKLQPDDTLIIRTVEDWQESADNFMAIKGEVKYPGIYSISKGEKLSSVIERAGGYTDKAYFRGAKFTRVSVQKLQQKTLEDSLERAEAEITQKQAALASTASSKEELDATKAALEGLLKNVEKLKSKRAEGRVVLRLLPTEEIKKTEFDLTLEAGDTLTIPQRPGVVTILGQVYNPTSLVYTSDNNASVFLGKAGGLTSDAEESDIYIVKADGSVSSRQQSSLGFKCTDDRSICNFGGFLSTPLEPGDTLVVPQKIERVSWMRDIKDITQILANVAVTVGTVLIGLK